MLGQSGSSVWWVEGSGVVTCRAPVPLGGSLPPPTPTTMFTKSIVAACLGLLAANATAQCATLTVTGTGAPGTALQFQFDGTANPAFVLLLVGQTQGTTTVPLGPFGSLTLGLATPFIPVPLGFTDASGDVSRSINVPSATTLSLDLFAQGVSTAWVFTPPSPPTPPSLSLTFCASNVAGFHLGV